MHWSVSGIRTASVALIVSTRLATVHSIWRTDYPIVRKIGTTCSPQNVLDVGSR